MVDLQWLMAIVLGLGFVGAAGLVRYVSYRERRVTQERRQEGVRLGRQLKQLLLDIQQCRGMINALLSGDKSFAPKVTQKQDSVDRDMSALDDWQQVALLSAKRWNDVRSQWKDLRAQAATLPIETSFERHSGLIREVLRCMGDVAERSQLGGVHAVDPVLVNVLWNKLPIAAECIGQARGMGASVAARGCCSSVVRIKLCFLEERIRETMALVSADLAGANCSEAASMAKEWQVASGTVSSFLDLLESSLLKVEHPTLDAEHYFATATKALEAVFQAFDHTTSALENTAAA
ncbi:MAG TPA: hypothetical protein VGK14_01550 [Novimethylophilus sp.]|jgi:hypothetical protein|uniref:hypothetical protein n=1 Tax=Novimethylophilus sp. TaxID=2137426 RepID=UPI002F42B348